MKNKKKKINNNYELGGTLDQKVGTQNSNTGQVIGNVAGDALALAGIPGLGGLLSTVGASIGAKQDELKTLKDHFSSISQGTNPYGNYEHGGELKGDNRATEYDGLLHSQGGIGVNKDGIPSDNPVAEVEDGEVRHKVGDRVVIFSSKLKI